MRLFTILIGVIALVVGAGGAHADGSIKDAPVAASSGCVSGSFGGAYIGANVGYAEHTVDIKDKLNGSGTVDGDDSGVTFGVYAGYNRQCDRLVYGIEADFNSLDIDSNWSDCCYENSSTLDSFGTLTGRLGLVHDGSMLIYVKGGLAFADVEHNFASPTLGFSQSNSDTQFGWTAGAGVDFLRRGNLLIRAEALYVDLGEETINYSESGCGISCEARIGWEDDFWVTRIGVAYRFGAREEAVPLK